MNHLDELRGHGAMSWRAVERAWVADPQGVTRALEDDGFQEYKREIAKASGAHVESGGIWQGLDPRTGTVATVIWVGFPPEQQAHVFIEIGGHAFEGEG